MEDNGMNFCFFPHVHICIELYTDLPAEQLSQQQDAARQKIQDEHQEKVNLRLLAKIQARN